MTKKGQNKTHSGSEKPLENQKPEKSKIKPIILVFFAGLAIFGALNTLFSGKVKEEEKTTFHSGEIKEAPVKGMVTMLDLGATECVPCKMMAPILAELEKAYKGRAEIVFIDVWKKPEYAKKFGIRSIPTQIFFDKDGKEAFRHTGFMDKKSIIQKMKQLGVSEPV